MIETNEVRLHFLDYWRVIRVRAGLITLVFLLVMITASVTTYFLPREYFSKVSIEVHPDNYKPLDMFGGAVSRTYDPQFVQTQFEILRKSDILYPVIRDLGLVKEYSGEGAELPLQQVFLMLNRDLVLEEKRNTSLIEIGVWNRKPELAARIANTIARVYRERRLDDLQEALKRALAQFENEVQVLQQKVIDDDKTAAQLRQTLGIVDPDPQSASAIITNKERSEVASEQSVNEERTKVEQIRTELERINTLKPDELMEALRTLNIEDQTVMKNMPLLQDSAAEEARLLRSGLGENHPRIQAIRAMNQTYRKNLSDELASIRRAQATRLKIAQDTLAALQGNLQDSTSAAITEKQKNSEYIAAKTQYLEDKRILEAAQMQLSTERMKQKIDIVPARVWGPAEPSSVPGKPPVKIYLALATLIGLIFGVGLAFFIEYLDTSVKTLDDVERFLQAPVLAIIPRDVPILFRALGDHPDAEAYRILRANIEFNKPAPDAKTLTIISAGQGEGKSTTLNNLAFTCAKGGYNVLVVDADLRRPSQHQLFETDNDRGLSDFVSGKTDLDPIVRTTKIDNLSFISAGQYPAENPALLNSQRMNELIRRVKTQYDLIFFDSPPILGVSDGSVLVSAMDMTLMVVQHRRFPRAMLQRVKHSVAQVGGKLVGIVLNNVDKRHDEGYAYYNAYNDYYPAAKRTAATPAAAPSIPRKATPAAEPARSESGEY